MEHRGDRHVHVAGTQQRLAVVGGEGAQLVQGVQHQLAVREVHPLGVAGGAGGVEQRGHRLLVEVLELGLGAGCIQQRFVLAEHRQRRGRSLPVRQLQVAFDRAQLAAQLLQQRHEVVMHQHQVILGVVHGVGHLLRRQANVHRVQHRANHRHGEEAFQRTVAVPVQQRDSVTGLHAGRAQHVGQAPHPLLELAVAVAQRVGVDDLLVRLVPHTRHQQAFDQQGVGIGAGCWRHYFCLGHDVVPSIHIRFD
ncbi:hypothetical protein D3C76_1067100 [compost metagenome]